MFLVDSVVHLNVKHQYDLESGTVILWHRLPNTLITNDSTSCRSVAPSVQRPNWKQPVSRDSYSGMKRTGTNGTLTQAPLTLTARIALQPRRVSTTHPRAVHQHQVQVRCVWRTGAYPPRCSREFAKAPCRGERIRAYVCTAGAPQPWLSHFSDTSELTRWFRVPGGILRPGAFHRVSFSDNGRTKGLSLCCTSSARGSKAIRESRSSDSRTRIICITRLLFAKKKAY